MQDSQRIRLKKPVIRLPVVSTSLFILLILSFFSGAAQQTVAGTITGSDGAPLAGASLSIKGSPEVTSTDGAGKFYIHAKKGDVLIVTNVGYRSQQILITDKPDINVTLNPEVINLDEVVLTGYTYQRLKDITGSVSVVKPQDLTAVPSGQVEEMLQGRAPGLNVINSGEPGAPSQIYLHGIGNFGDVRPLYIIDGVEGDINSLNPYDIESLQVLKDAGAYSIYGARGANGVIIITTKKGRNAKTTINYDFYVGRQQPLKRGLDILNPQELGNLLWIADKNSGIVDANGNPNDPLFGIGAAAVMPDYLYAGPYFGLKDGDPLADPSLYNLDYTKGAIYQIVRFDKKGTDWFHTTFKPAWSQNHSVSVSGGNDKNKYLFSVGYLDQNGTFLNTYLKRYTARINTEFTVKNFLRIGENAQLAYIDNPRSTPWDPATFSDHSDLSQMLTMLPYRPIYDIKGNWSSGSSTTPRGPMDNPLFVRTMAKNNKNNKWQIFGNAYAEADFLKHFTFRSSFGGSMDYFYNYNYSYPSFDAPYPAGNGYPGRLSENSGYTRSWTWTNTLNFSESFWKNNHIKILAGTEEISDYSRDQGGIRTGFHSDNPDYWLLTNGNPLSQTNMSAAVSSYLASFLSRLDYNFNEKYFFSATVRKDGSSVFGPKDRFGWFPAVMGAWRITQEKFMENISAVKEMKLRISWGKTGYNGNTNPLNQYTVYGGTPEDAWYDIFGTSNSIVQGFRTVNIGNARTGWQQDAVTNIGLETLLWNGKLNVTADWYVKNSNGLLFPASLPALLGAGNPPNLNIGQVRNTGLDVLLSTKGNFSKNWNWDVVVNFSTYKNRITRLNVFPFFEYNSFLMGGLVRNEIGHPIGAFYGYNVTGYFSDDNDVTKSAVQDGARPGSFKYLDANKDGVITDDDRVFIGNPNPKFTTGININIGFKNFNLSTFFFASCGNDVYNGLKTLNIGGGAITKTALYDSWTPDHKNAKAPALQAIYNFSNIAYTTSYPIEKGSFLKNKSVMLSYSLSKKWLEKTGVNRFRIYLQVVNLFTLTKYSGLDPEVPGISQAFGNDSGSYPNNQRQYLLGLNLNF
jgi:TonB-linked SusC/RagA family outer membrane protein